MSERPAEEAELQAYVDGRLDGARRAEVEAYLAARPQEAERLRAYRRQDERLRALYDPVLDEPLPARLRRAPGLAYLRHGAVAASLLLGAAAGWFARGAQAPHVVYPAVPPLARQAAVAHAVYTPEVQHPVEVGAAQEEHLVKWLSKRLGAPLRAPHLSGAGFELVGGRLLPGAQRPAAQFLYQDAQGGRLTLYVSADRGERGETAFRYARADGVGVFYWVDGALGYALAGELERERLLTVAEAVYRELNR